jgi:YgiT-type zinc finger domain-containing protein
MIGHHEQRNGRCALCGGSLDPDQRATIPFVLETTIVVVKDVPAEVCDSCREPYPAGDAVDRITELLRQLRHLHTEVTVVSYTALPEAA